MEGPLFKVRIGQWNVRSVFSQAHFISSLLSVSALNVLCLQETWLASHSRYSLPGYNVFRTDRDRRGGGVLIAVCSDWAAHPLPLPHLDPSVDAVAVLVRGPSFSFTVASVYCPRSTLGFSALDTVLGCLFPPLVVCGDFNLHHPSWDMVATNTGGRDLFHYLNDHLEFQLLNDGTSTMACSIPESAPDLTLVTSGWARDTQWHTGPIGLSDHLSVMTTLSLASDQHELTPVHRRWRHTAADWERYNMLLQNAAWEPITSVAQGLTNFTHNVLHAAAATIPRCSAARRLLPRPWWTSECSSAVQQRNAGLRAFRRDPTIARSVELKRLQAVLRRTIRNAKRVSWRTFCARIRPNAHMTSLWRAYRSMSVSKRSSLSWPPITTAEGSILAANEVAAAFASRLRDTYACVGPTPAVRPGPADRSMDSDFTPDELSYALRRIRSDTPGPDGLTGPMLRHLPIVALDYLLQLINYGWRAGEFPSSLKAGTVVMIPKPSRPVNDIASYRPITLLSQVSKAWERVVLTRLTWWLLHNSWWSVTQHGSVPGRGPHSALAALTAFVRRNRRNGASVALLFMDIAGAFDSVSYDAIIDAATRARVPPRLAAWLTSYFQDRTAQVRIVGHHSSTVYIRRGVPQGAVLSALLYTMATDNFRPSVNPPFGVQYIDDVCVGAAGESPTRAVKKLRDLFPRLRNWASNASLCFNEQKTKLLVVSSNRRFHGEVRLCLDGIELSPSSTVVYLGIHLDSRFTWKAQVAHLKGHFLRVQQFLQAISSPTWGADVSTLVIMFQALIYSRLRYSAVCLSTATPSIIGQLDIAINNVMRTCTSLPRSTNLLAVYAEAGVLPPTLLRTLHVGSLHYSLSVRMRSVFPTALSSTDGGNLPPIAADVCALVSPHGHPPIGFSTRMVAPVPPWTYCESSLIAPLPFRKGDCSPYNAGVLTEWLATQNHTTVFYTDASYGAGHDVYAGWCTFPHSDSRVRQLPSYLPIFYAELYAVQMVLDHLLLASRPSAPLVCTDSRSVLEHIRSPPGPVLYDDLHHVYTALRILRDRGINVSFLWVPSHSGIPGNELIDSFVARVRPQVFRATVLSVRACHARFRRVVRVAWQTRWERATTHCRVWNPNVNCRLNPLDLPRRSLWLLSLARVGRIRTPALAHRWRPTVSPFCATCPQIPCTVYHVLLECPTTAARVRECLTPSQRLLHPNELYPRLLGIGCASTLCTVSVYTNVVQILSHLHSSTVLS